MATMRAALCRAYGPPHVVCVEEVERPVPKADEVLIRVRATTVSSGDWRVRTLTVPRGMGMMVRAVFGFMRPRNPILGTELAGEIVGLGSDVMGFSVGDAVETREHLVALRAMAEAGWYRPVIDQIFPFERIADAHARVETRRKRGSVVVTI